MVKVLDELLECEGLQARLFDRIPKIGEKNPAGEVSFVGYKRQFVDSCCGFSFKCEDKNGATVQAIAILDTNNVVIKVIDLTEN